MNFLKITFFGCLLFFASNNITAQTEVENWDAKLQLDGTEMKKEIKIKVSESSKEVSVHVSGSISGGYLKATLYDPNGKRYAGLNLCAGPNSKAKGSLSETEDAMAGIWVLKVNSDEATGKVNIEVKQN